jgi:hypothetical protein
MIGTLGSATDLQLEQPGLPLTLSRSFQPVLSGRYNLSVFGRGWTFEGGWLQTLVRTKRTCAATA